MNKNLIYCLPLLFISTLKAEITYTINHTSLIDAVKKISELSNLPYIVNVDIFSNQKANPIKNITNLSKALKLMFKNTTLEALVSNNTIVIRKKISTDTSIINNKALEDILIIGEQHSYYNEYSSTSMKGVFRDIETPYTTNTTNETLINDTQALKIADTYTYTTGLVKSDPRADGIIMRGFEVNLQNIQVNGMPGLLSRFGSPTTANVEKIEVSNSPSSTLYGNMEAGGFINIITKKPEAQNKVMLETSYNTYASNTSNAGEDNSFTVSLDATGTITDNVYYRFIAVKESLQSYRGKNLDYKNYYLYPSLLWNINDQSSLLFAIEYGKEYANADEGLAALDNNISSIKKIDTYYQEKNDYDNDKGVIADLKFEHYFIDESLLNISWRSVLHTDERNLYENYAVNNADETLIRRYRNQKNKRIWHTLDTNYQFKANIFDLTNFFTIGSTLSYRMHDFDRLGYSTSNLTGIDLLNPIYGESTIAHPNNKRRTKYTSSAFYLQNKIDITNDLTFVNSVRIDKTDISFDCIRGESDSCKDNQTSSQNIIGSLGAIYSLNYFTSIFTNLSQGYDPTTAERVDKNNKGLDSEHSEQIEIGIKLNKNKQFNATLSIYDIFKKNVAEKVEDNIYTLTKQTKSKGLEFDLQWLPSKNWQIKAGYSYNDTINISKKQEYKNSNTPQNTFFIFTRYNFPEKKFQGMLGVSAGLYYKDTTYTSSNKDDAVTLPAYAKFDLGVYYSKDNWSLSLNLKNITNKVYYEYGDDDYSIYSGDPRNITINYKITF